MLLQDFDCELEYIEGRTNVVADCLSRMTNNFEHVDDLDSLGSSIVQKPLVMMAEMCEMCASGREYCDLCGVEFCAECENVPTGLPVHYCAQCIPKLDPLDPSMNIDLLRLLSGEDEVLLIQ